MKNILYILSLFLFVNGYSQIGGDYSFSFLNLAENAKVAALGGELISNYDSADVNSGSYNPANIQSDHNKQIGINFLPLKQGIKKSSVAYVHEFKKVGAINFNIQHIGYGEIATTDNLGNETGTINPQEYAISVGKSFEQGIFKLGTALKIVGSSFGEYNASALMLDLGGTLVHPNKRFTASLLLKNVGFALGKYTKDSEVTVPLNVLAGVTYKPEHMPIRFSVTTHNWQQLDVQFLDTTQTFEIDENGDQVVEEKKLTEQIFRHFNIGGELILAKGLQVRVGYSHMRRKELKTEDKGGAGFSFGGMLKIKRFTIEYTKAYYFAGSGSSVISLITHFKK